MASSKTNATAEPRIEEFGPFRVLGLRYTGKNEHCEIKALWDGKNGMLERWMEIKSPASQKGIAFGLCRCLPGVKDGSFEYIAGAPATVKAPVPDGMVEAHIGKGTYVIFPVASLDVLMQAWGATGKWFAAHPEWEGYCGPAGCDCANHPCFEFYPADFPKNGLFIYLPIRRKA